MTEAAAAPELSVVMVFDAVLPRIPRRRPIAWMIRHMNRGRWMRHGRFGGAAGAAGELANGSQHL